MDLIGSRELLLLFSWDVLPLPLLWGCSISQQLRNSYFLCQKTQLETLSERENPFKRCRFVLLGGVFCFFCRMVRLSTLSSFRTLFLTLQHIIICCKKSNYNNILYFFFIFLPFLLLKLIL